MLRPFACVVVATLFAGGALGDEPVKPRSPLITISPETTRITKPLRADGYVDYIQYLNDMSREGVTAENNAAVELVRVIGPKPEGTELRPAFYAALGIEPLPEDGDYFVDSHEQLKSVGTDEIEKQWEVAERPWSAEEAPLLAGWLKANSKQLDRVVEAVQRDRLWLPLIAGEDRMLISVLLPHVQGFRNLARALRARALLRAKSGDVAGALRDSVAIHRLGRLVGQRPFLISSLVGLAIESMARQTTVAVLHETEPGPAELARLVEDWADLPERPPFAQRLDEGERFFFLDSVSALARGGSSALHGLDVLPATTDQGRGETLRVAMNMLVDWDAVLIYGNRWYDRLVVAARKRGYAGRNQAMQQFNAELKRLTSIDRDTGRLLAEWFLADSNRELATKRISRLLVAMLLPAIEAVLEAETRGAQEDELLMVAMALAKYRADHDGAYPATLAALAPKYVAAAPRDLYHQKPLGYRPIDGGYRLVSYGPNGKDDAGRSGQDPGDDVSLGTHRGD